MFINQKIVIGIIVAILILIFGFLFLFLGPLRCLSQPFIERIINETPEAKITSYLEAVRENDKRKALEFWQLPDWEGWKKRSKRDLLLSNRRENVTKELVAMDIKDFNIFDIEWWGTCCEPTIINDHPQTAGFARTQVKLITHNNEEIIYIFDIFTQKGYYAGLCGYQDRHWTIRDVYQSGKEPLLWKARSWEGEETTWQDKELKN